MKQPAPTSNMLEVLLQPRYPAMSSEHLACLFIDAAMRELGAGPHAGTVRSLSLVRDSLRGLPDPQGSGLIH
jgi:hypothetical protein